MIITDAEAIVRRRINQTSTTNTLFSTTMINEMVDQGRRMFAVILPEEMLPNLRVYETTTQDLSSGFVAYRSDFLRPLRSKIVKIGTASPPTVIATEIEEWRIRFLESNNLTSSDTVTKYYRETGSGVQSYPSSDTKIIYPYLKIPDNLDGSANVELPLDVEDMVIDYAFEKIMGTPHGSDYELAGHLAKTRGYLTKEVAR